MITENKTITDAILAQIQKHDRIVLCRHENPDGDAMGSSLALARIIRLTWPDKDVRVVNTGIVPDSLSFLEPEDTCDVSFYEGALVIALDCAVLNRMANKDYARGDFFIKIDHHPNVEPFGDLCWVEPHRGATSEMIADLAATYADVLKMDAEAALELYVGIVTDTGRFQFGTTPETMRICADLLAYGFDTSRMFANLYLEDYEYKLFCAQTTAQIQRTEAGVAWLYITQETQEKYHLTHEQAGNTVLLLNDIKGSMIRIVFIDNGDGTTRVRLRSRFIVINTMAEKYHGGGHAFASGATVHNAAEMQALLHDADKLQREYVLAHNEVK